MDFIKRNRKIIECAIFGVFTVLFLTILIIAFTHIDDLNDIRQSIKDLESQMGHYGDVFANETLSALRKQYNKMLTPIIFEIILMFISTICSLIGLCFVLKEDEVYKIINVLGGVLLGVGLLFIVEYSNVISIINDTNNEPGSYIPNIEIPGEYIANLVFGILITIASLLIFILDEFHITIKKVMPSVIGLMLLIASAIQLSLLKGGQDKDICATVFLLLCSIILLPSFILIGDYDYKYAAINRPLKTTLRPANVSTTIKSNSTVVNNSIDAIAQLRNLKALFDEGIITEEEYNTKRKKYVDML